MDNFLPFYRSPLCVVLLFFNGCAKSSDSPQNEMKVRQGDGEGCSLGSVAVSWSFKLSVAVDGFSLLQGICLIKSKKKSTKNERRREIKLDENRRRGETMENINFPQNWQNSSIARLFFWVNGVNHGENFSALFSIPFHSIRVGVYFSNL